MNYWNDDYLKKLTETDPAGWTGQYKPKNPKVTDIKEVLEELYSNFNDDYCCFESENKTTFRRAYIYYTDGTFSVYEPNNAANSQRKINCYNNNSRKTFNLSAAGYTNFSNSKYFLYVGNDAVSVREDIINANWKNIFTKKQSGGSTNWSSLNTQIETASQKYKKSLGAEIAGSLSDAFNQRGEITWK